MTPKEFYRTYEADDTYSELSKEAIRIIKEVNPVHVLEFGCGSGKNLNKLNQSGISTIGIDISMMNIIRCKTIYNLPCVVCADENYLRNFVNVDVVFTVSVLDHIEKADGIIDHFKRICNRRVVLAETNDMPGKYYYPHDYESYGFKKKDFKWTSNDDGARYYIWVYDKCAE